MLQNQEWDSFTGRLWKEECNVRDFIQNNYTMYDGDESFLAGPTDATNKLWDKLQALQKAERYNGGVLKEDADVVSSITAYGPGYIDPETKDLEQVVGLQTDEPLKRAFMPYGGIKMAEEALEMYGYKPNENFHKIFTEYHKTHNQAVFDAYTPEMKAARHTHIVTGLPDTYGRGRIVGDYRRVALYGIDQLIAWKEEDKANCGDGNMFDDVIRQREELAEQIRRLQEMKVMAQSYGYDISKPASNAKEAVQWLYFGYLSAIKTQNGAAMSVGRVSTFLDIYIERDIKAGKLTEAEAQELISQERAAQEAQQQAAAAAAEQNGTAGNDAATTITNNNRNNTASSNSGSSSNSNKNNASSSATNNSKPQSVSGNSVVNRAYSQLGKPYQWSAVGPNSFDCSGLVSYCLTGSYSRLGTTGTFMGWTRVSNPQPGDICVNSHHCGIYIGGGQMIHAPRTGDVVKVSSVHSDMIYVRY